MIIKLLVASAVFSATAAAGPTAVLAAWDVWAAKQPKVCHSELDSQAIFHDGNSKVALVLHGYASSPAGMEPLIQLLVDNGYNVLAPRLARHFTADLRDLDNANYTEWISESEQAFKIARSYGQKVTMVGFSLGGLLASRLALHYPGAVDRLVLVAPLWRISAMAGIASMAGNLFKISLNEVEHWPVTCGVDGGYVSARGVHQMELLTYQVENEHGYYNFIGLPSVYSQIRAPQLVITSKADPAVDSDIIGQICDAGRNCNHVSVAGLDHGQIIHRLSAHPEAPYNGYSLADLIERFLR